MILPPNSHLMYLKRNLRFKSLAINMPIEPTQVFQVKQVPKDKFYKYGILYVQSLRQCCSFIGSFVSLCEIGFSTSFVYL